LPKETAWIEDRENKVLWIISVRKMGNGRKMERMA
jgi:hypothetical protein